MERQIRSYIQSLSNLVLLFLVIVTALPCRAGPSSVVRPSFVCSISFSQSASPTINTIYVPFNLVGRLIVVEAQLDTMKGNFIVDTGSERLLLNQDYMPESGSGAMVTAMSNTGFVSAKECKLDSLHIDRLRIDNLMAHLVDLNHIEIKKNTKILGILGYHVFKDFELFIDFANARIVLSRVDKKGNRLDPVLPWETPFDSMSFDIWKHFIVIKTEVNSVKLNMILDSGAELNLIDRKVNKKVMEQFAIIRRVNLIGVGKQQVEVLAGTMSEVTCGNQSCLNMNTLLTSLDEMNASF